MTQSKSISIPTGDTGNIVLTLDTTADGETLTVQFIQFNEGTREDREVAHAKLVGDEVKEFRRKAARLLGLEVMSD